LKDEAGSANGSAIRERSGSGIMSFTIWGRRSSSSAQRVFWALDELGLDYRQIDAGRTFGVVDTPEYQSRNPFGLVPTLETDDGFVLWESNVIVRFLAATHPQGRLWPRDARSRALSERWMDWTATVAAPAINRLFWQTADGRRTGGRDGVDGGLAADLAVADQALQRLAVLLGPARYVGGDQLTIGDIPLGVVVNRWFQLPVRRPPCAALEAYYDRLCERPAYMDNVVKAPPVL